VNSKLYLAARLSLSFLWLFTGITSQFFAKQIGYDVLANIGITDTFADWVILSGSLLDMFIGIWLLTGKKLKLCYLIQLITIISYSLLLTIIEPEFWIHPFGPLTKNIPLLVMIYYLYTKE
jgi:hypothetical protein